MHRKNMLAVVVVLFASAPCFAQFGGMGGMGGGMGMGGMGMGRMGMMRQITRAVVVEMEGGQKIEATLLLAPVTVEGELGKYEIRPDSVKAIRLSRPGTSAGMVNGLNLLEGSVITTSDKEIKGKIQCPQWNLDLDFGTLTIDPTKVRTLTFSAPDEPKETKKEHVSQARPASLNVSLIEGPNVVALMVSGKKITRLAAAAKATGNWIPVDLRAPVEGQAMPIVGNGVVVYGLGRHVYAFSSDAKRWDVLDLPEGVRATPIVGNQSARVEYDGQIHEFSAATGKWKHIDFNSLLDALRNQ